MLPPNCNINVSWPHFSWPTLYAHMELMNFNFNHFNHQLGMFTNMQINLDNLYLDRYGCQYPFNYPSKILAAGLEPAAIR